MNISNQYNLNNMELKDVKLTIKTPDPIYLYWRKRALQAEKAFKELLILYKEKNGIKEKTCEEEVKDNSST